MSKITKMNKKYSIDFFRTIAHNHKGKCLSTVYTNIKTKLHWQCSKGHQWTALPSSILYQNSWCPKCRNENISKRQRGNLKHLCSIANMRGGKCLAVEYLGVKHKIEWECSMNHKWKARPSDIKRGCWCPICSKISGAKKRKKYSLNDIKKIINHKGGKCLSTKYNNTSDKIQLKCKNGHIWSTKAYKLILGHWCIKCHNYEKRINIKTINKLLKNKNIKCLNIEHSYKKTRIKLLCLNKHVWNSDLSCIRKKTGCPICSNRKKHTIKDMKKLAIKNQGNCLSEKYVNNSHHLRWQCVNNHKWNAVPKIILQNGWCPTCRCFYTINEEKCRFIFQSLLCISFCKNRQVIKPLELDGYNESINLGFEYNGELHYKFIPGIHKTFDNFLKQKKRDKQKKILCNQKNIKLIIIPYIKAKTDKDLITYITINIKTLFPKLILHKLNMNNFVYKPNMLKELNNIANKHGGKCLSTVYVNNKQHLHWQCSKGHQWHTSASTIKRGCWCPMCALQKQK